MHFRFILASVILFCTGPALWAQYENVWPLGSSAAGGSGLDFNTVPPTFIQTSMIGHEGTASVCDNNGQLLFYTQGTTIWDKNNNPMPNGSNLAPYQTSSSTLGVVIVPMPANAGKYYVLSLTSYENGDNMGRLYYSVVDMSLNNGLGDVMIGQKTILVDSLLTERMTAFVGQRCNVWLLAVSRSPRSFKAYEITDAGINAPVISNVGSTNSIYSALGFVSVSPDKKRVAVNGYDIPYALTIYDLDAATGIVSQPLVIMPAISTPVGISTSYGNCFSPDNTKLYVSFTSGYGIYQFDLSSNDSATIVSSRTLLDNIPGAGPLKLGPDGKIYFHAPTYTTFGAIGTINSPNNAGLACGLTPDALPVPDATSSPWSGFPNVVPVIIRDTIYNTQTVSPPCFTTGVALYAANDTTGWDYLWSDGTAGQSIAANSPGTYWVSYHEPPHCTYHVDTFYVSETSIPLLHAVAGCKQDTNAAVYAIPMDTLAYIYTWFLNNQIVRGPLLSNYGDTLDNILNGTTYTLQINAPNGCDTAVEITTPLPGYQAAFAVSDSIICMNGSVSFLNASQGGLGDYQWDFGDGNTSSVENPQHTYAHAGWYSVRLTARTPYPCNDTANKIIVVDSILSGRFTAAPDSICTGESIVFTPEFDSTTLALSWQWGDGTGFTSSNEVIRHAFDQDGVLTVQLTSHYRACPDVSFTDTVYVYPLPVVNLGPDSGLCLNGAAIFLKNIRPAPTTAYSQFWNTGEQTESIKVVHPGTYSLTISTAPLGCSTTETIEVRKDCYIDIPNVFTPNNDGVNDYFFPRQLLSEKISAFKMKIFNRWGQVIFETERTDGRGWDGKFNGADQPQGVYIYLIEVALDKRVEERYQGNVTLLR